MKRLTALVMAVLFVLFAFGTVYADDSQQITCTVTMLGVAITLNGPAGYNSWAIGQVNPSQVKTRAESTYVKNAGGVNMDVTFQGDSAATWKEAATAAKDTFRLRAVFASKTTASISADSFLANDNATYIAQEGTSSLFYTSNCGSGADAGGLDIAAGDSITLWLQFQAPTTSTVTAEQTFHIVVGGKLAD
jgi:hypothetical protein